MPEGFQRASGKPFGGARAATPGGAFEMAYLLGKDETMKRLDDAMAKL